jgi:hypothetical protein
VAKGSVSIPERFPSIVQLTPAKLEELQVVPTVPEHGPDKIPLFARGNVSEYCPKEWVRANSRTGMNK